MRKQSLSEPFRHASETAPDAILSKGEVARTVPNIGWNLDHQTDEDQ